jgi:hypothetical protein
VGGSSGAAGGDPALRGEASPTAAGVGRLVWRTLVAAAFFFFTRGLPPEGESASGVGSTSGAGARKWWPLGHRSTVPAPALVVRSAEHSEHLTVRGSHAIGRGLTQAPPVGARPGEHRMSVLSTGPLGYTRT